MTAQLEKCPFCGAGETQIKEGPRMWQGMKYGEPASVSVIHWCTATPGQPLRSIERIGRDEASAIEAWNRRAPAAPVSAPAEPVAWRYKDSRGHWRYVGMPFSKGWTPSEIAGGHPLYAAAPLPEPQRQQPATKEGSALYWYDVANGRAKDWEKS